MIRKNIATLLFVLAFGCAGPSAGGADRTADQDVVSAEEAAGDIQVHDAVFEAAGDTQVHDAVLEATDDTQVHGTEIEEVATEEADLGTPKDLPPIEEFQGTETDASSEALISDAPTEVVSPDVPEPLDQVPPTQDLGPEQTPDVAVDVPQVCIPSSDPQVDSDGDGYPDLTEKKNGSDPCDPNSSPEDLDKDGIPDGQDDDIDGDGVPNLSDDFPFDPSEVRDTDGDGVGDNADEDDDGDGFPDTLETDLGSDPKDPASRPSDLDGDGVPDGVDDDMDGDGVANADDAFPSEPKEWADADEDGVGDNADEDDDNDGYPDAVEVAAGTDPKNPNDFPSDMDGDGLPDTEDPDMDGDGALNDQDAFPKDPGEWRDTDGDGIGDNADEDDDGDGYSDALEAKFGSDPLDPKSVPDDRDHDGIPDLMDSDIDGDGEPNISDVFPFDPSEWRDSDRDGLGDNADPDDDNDGFWDSLEEELGTDPKDPKSHPADLDKDGIPDPRDPDRDGDGVPNEMDLFPDDPTEWADHDGDGIGDNKDPDDDNDGYPDAVETLYGSDPYNAASVPPDMDHDGIPDADDPDRDADGVPNAEDAFPSDPTEWLDTDGDGIGNNRDPDDDNDGYPDQVEVAQGTNPLDPTSRPNDMDGDGIPDSEDPDMDGDGRPNDQDAFPKDPKEWVDSDGDGIGDNGDLDDDGDCYSDKDEAKYGTDSLDPDSVPDDLDHDCIPDADDLDRDGDGVLNDQDAFPEDPLEWVDTDHDGQGNNADTDDDNDGYSDALEIKYKTDPLDPTSTPPDMDHDGIPNPEDLDRDGDGVLNDQDAFPDDPTKWEQYVPPGSYGDEYQGEIPEDASKDAFVPEQFALIRGHVLDPAGEPAVGAKVTVLDHPEYGTARVRKDGSFVIAVNGGGYVTLNVELEGSPKVQRTNKVPWNDTVVWPTIRLTARDEAASEVPFNGEAGQMAVHQNTGGFVRATVVLPRDASVVAEDESGQKVSVAAATIRATEYPTEDSMPGVLPPTSQYTYCVEAEADGFTNVEFDKPVVLWLPNKLGFDVGDAVPVGYYDRKEATWKPMPDGVVVRLLDTNGDTKIDAVDADGDGLPNDLDGDGAVNDETAGLDQAKGFKAGDTAWRVVVRHFSPLDLNYPGGPPPDAIPPNPGDPSADNRGNQPDKDDPCKKVGYSSVESRSRVLHEDVRLGFSNMVLHYSSEWVDGFAQPVRIPLSGETVPGSLKEIRARYGIAGLAFETSRPPQPRLIETFLWDGRDYLGQVVTKKVNAWADITYVYPSFYYSNRAQLLSNAASFAAAGVKVTGIGSRQDATLTKHFEFPVYRFRPRTPGQGVVMPQGWVFGPYWFYDQTNGTVVSAFGQVHETKDLGRTAETIGPSVLPAPPQSLAVDSRGRLYFAAKDERKVWRIENGTLSEFVDFSVPMDDIAIGPRDTLHFAAGDTVYRMAGTTPKALANLYFDFFDCFAYYGAYCRLQIAIDRYSYLHVVGRYPGTGGQNRMVVVTPDGTVLRFPLPFNCVVADMALDFQGRMFFSCQNGPVYILDPDGKTVRQVPGWNEDCNEFWGYSGGGGLFVDEEGAIYLADTKCNRIRRVDPVQGAATIAGTGAKGFGGDGGSPLAAVFNSPRAVLVGPDGFLYVADTGNNRIRAIVSKRANIEGPLVPLESGLLLRFDSAFVLQEVQNAITGATIYRYQYDQTTGRLIGIEGTASDRVMIQYDQKGRPSKVVDGISGEVTFEYDDLDRLSKVVHPDGTTETFQYAYNGLLTRKTINNYQYSYEYDSTGRVVRVTDPVGGGQAFSMAVEGGKRIYTNRTAGGIAVQFVDEETPDGRSVSTVEREPGLQRVVETSPDGLTTTTKEPDGSMLSVTYGFDPKFGTRYPVLLRHSTPSGKTQVITFSRTYDEAGVVTEKAMYPDGTAIMVTDPINGVFTNTSPMGLQQKVVFDTATNLPIRIESPGVLPEVYQRDESGRVTRIERGERGVDIVYGPRGIAAVQDAGGARLEVIRDILGQAQELRLPDGSTVQIERDYMGYPVTFVRPSGARVVYTRDALGNLTKADLGGGHVFEFAYSNDRMPTSVKYPSGALKTIEHTFGAVTKITHSDEGAVEFAYYADGSGRLKSITSADGYGDLYEYDGFLVTRRVATGTPPFALSRDYDGDFRLIGLKGGVFDVAITYDADDRPTSVGPLQLTYNAQNGKPETLTFGTLKQRLTYNAYGEVVGLTVSASDNSLWGFSLERDSGGRVVAKTEGGTTVQYAYDALDRLAEVRRGGFVAEAYEYDLNGNRVQATVPALGWLGATFTVDGGDRLVESPDGTYEYDANGHLAKAISKDGKVTLFHNSAAGHLRSVTLPDGRVVEYLYDGQGLRAAKKVNGTLTERYVYEGNQLLAVLAPDGTVREQYLWLGDVPVLLKKGGETYFVAIDEFGSVRRIYSTVGVLVQAYDYDAFGNRTATSNPSFTMALGYSGALQDPDTGLIRLGLRDYDPRIGRFIQADPGGLEFSENLYALAAGPDRHDRNGLWEIKIDWFTGIGLGVRIGHTPDGHWWVCPQVGVGVQWGADFSSNISLNSVSASLSGKVDVSLGPLSGGFDANAKPPITLTNPGYNATYWDDFEVSGSYGLGGALGVHGGIKARLGECENRLSLGGGLDMGFKSYDGEYTWSSRPGKTKGSLSLGLKIGDFVKALKAEPKVGGKVTAKGAAVGCHVVRF